MFFVLVLGITACGGELEDPRGTATTNGVTTSTFPIGISANGRYLVSANGQPFLLHADTAWYLFTDLTKTETAEYLENRRLKGFNAILTQTLNSTNNGAPFTSKEEQAPFTTVGDFSTPNEAYFAHQDWVIQKAKEKGILVILNPVYTGYSGDGKSSSDGVTKWIISNGPTKCRNFGRYLGKRYKGYTNIVWQAVGDSNPPPGGPLEQNSLEIIKGIKEFSSSLWSAHYQRFSTARDRSAFAPYMDLDNAYGGNRSYVHTLRAYNRSNAKPTFYNEGFYEDASADLTTPYAPKQQRAQAYWSLLSGATGHIFGSRHVYGFGNRFSGSAGLDWRKGMNLRGSSDMVHVKALFQSFAWHNLVPDQKHNVVTAGYGTFGVDDRTAGGDYVTAARTGDGKLVMAYVSSTTSPRRTITVNMASLTGPTTARWYNPTNGKYVAVNGSPFANAGSHAFITPGDNGTATYDWVLVLEAASDPAVSPVPAAPSGLYVSALSSTVLRLVWSDNSPNETGFEIDRAKASAGPWTQIGSVASNVTSYSNSGLLPSTTYFYRVRATNGAGDSPNSNVSSMTTLKASASGTNLVPNGDMESAKWITGVYGGTPYVASWATDAYRSSNHAMKTTSNVPYFNYLRSARFAITPGKTYTASMWVKTVGLTGGNVRLNVKWLDTLGREIRWDSALGGLTTGTNDWKRVHETMRPAPANAVTAEVNIRVQVNSGTSWVDDVSVVEGSSPGT